MVCWTGPPALSTNQRIRKVGSGSVTAKRKRPKTKPLRYFFYRGDLHKKIHINRGQNLITAWNYPKGTLEKYVYTDVRQNGEKAFSTEEVGELVNREVRTLKKAIKNGDVRKPQITYGLDENRNEFKYFWCEKDILDLHEYLSSVHYGRPRKDGRVTPKELPTASELRAMIRQGTVLYAKVGDEFVPTWRANNL
jgi:hypothetical protein